MNLILLDHRQDTVELPAADPRAVHLRQVLRAESGRRVRVGVRGGAVGTATLHSTRSGYRLACTWEDASPAALPVSLLLGHPRPPVLRRLVRDLSAMRIARLLVCTTTLTERSYLQSSVWDQIDSAVDDGLSQGAHTAAPEIGQYRSLSAALAALAEPAPLGGGAPPAGGVPPAGGAPPRDASMADRRAAPHRWMAATTGSRRPLLHMLNAVSREGVPDRQSDPQAVVLAVGPERGFTGAEEQALMEEGFSRLALGSSILRTETAAVTLCAAVCAALSDLSEGAASAYPHAYEYRE